MPGRRPLDRLVVGALEIVVRQLWGFTPPLMGFVVADLGPLRAMAWFCAHMPRYMRTLTVLGPVRTHLACLVISLQNGCRYCAFGQAHALELLYLRDRDVLFPVDAATLATDWLGLGVDELRSRMHAVLQRAGMHAEVLWVDRTLDLVTGDQLPIDAAEARIAHLIRMLGVLNAVGVRHEIPPDEAHDAVNKDRAVRRRFEELRSAV